MAGYVTGAAFSPHLMLLLSQVMANIVYSEKKATDGRVLEILEMYSLLPLSLLRYNGASGRGQEWIQSESRVGYYFSFFWIRTYENRGYRRLIMNGYKFVNATI